MTKSLTTVPSGTTSGMQKYLSDIRKYPMLQPQEEYMLAKRLIERNDRAAAEKLVTSHLRLVAKIAAGYRGYGLPMAEVISEGNIGLLQAVKKFDPDKGFRLATYAMWWIKAAIQEYVLRSWSLVKIGTTNRQKRLFFNLRKLKNKLGVGDKQLSTDNAKLIAKQLDVDAREVTDMEQRLSGDASLNAPLSTGEDDGGQWQDWLADETDSQETILIEQDELQQQREKLQMAMKNLTKRERQIFIARRLNDPPSTLDSLSNKYKISGERIRQIETRAFEKIQQELTA